MPTHPPKCNSVDAYMFEQKISGVYFPVLINGTIMNYTGVPKNVRKDVLWKYMKEKDCLFDSLECS